MKRGIRLLAMCMLGAALGSCVCTEIGCQDAIAVTFVDGPALGAGTFTVTSSSEGISRTCTVTTDAEGSFAPDDARCERDAALYVEPDGDWSVVLPVIDREATDGTLSVTVTRGGTRVLEALDVPYTLEPVQPNGPHCPPTCMQAQVDVR